MSRSDFDSEQEERADGAASLRRPRRERWILAGAGVLALVALSLGNIVGTAPTPGGPSPVDAAEQAEQADQEEPTPPPVQVPMPAPAPIGDEAVATEAVVSSVETLVDATNEVLQRADGGTEGIESVATGFVEG
ncbi:MAG TPA: hypothetical protein VFE99_08615, partial [Agromyces sp.]|nr:hypothetical protein [Agromyces sp.]